MTKILLVEDDKSLREIYGVRLKAEGYDIVSAGDGEEALAIAIKERPDLVISDVMMPKVSGFDMLDILRSTTETKNIKVIVMTALSSEEQRQRGEMLGANKYLVKSQVGTEDVVRSIHEVLGDAPVSPTASSTPFAEPLPSTPPTTPAPTNNSNQSTGSQANQDNAEPSELNDIPSAPIPDSQPPVAAFQNPATAQPFTPAQAPAAQTATTAQVIPGATTPSSASEPQLTPTPAMPQTDSAPAQTPTSRQGARVIQPLGDINQPTIDINSLLDKEAAKEITGSSTANPIILSTAETQSLVNQQINSIPAPQPATDSPFITGEPTSSEVTDLSVSQMPPNTDQSATPVDPVMGSAGTSNNLPLQNRENEPVIQPQQPPSQPGSALSGTTLPPTSIM